MNDDYDRRADETLQQWLDRTHDLVNNIYKTKLKYQEPKPSKFTLMDVIRAHAMGVEL